VVTNALRPQSATTKAKINLYLHISGKREDGYHFLDSLAAFADIGDDLVLTPGQDFAVTIDGPFADQVTDRPDLVERTARTMADRFDRPLDFALHLTKNLPVAAGIGGGSGDAAAVMRLLARRWTVSVDSPEMLALAVELGADIPICLHGKAAYIDGIGDRFYPALGMPSVPCLLVNNGVGVSTPSVFKAYRDGFRDPDRAQVLPRQPKAFARLLGARENVLTEAACAVEPSVKTVLAALSETEPLLARMSGSGGTCFALYETEDTAQRAAKTLQSFQPEWWVESCLLR